MIARVGEMHLLFSGEMHSLFSGEMHLLFSGEMHSLFSGAELLTQNLPRSAAKTARGRFCISQMYFARVGFLSDVTREVKQHYRPVPLPRRQGAATDRLPALLTYCLPTSK